MEGFCYYTEVKNKEELYKHLEDNMEVPDSEGFKYLTDRAENIAAEFGGYIAQEDYLDDDLWEMLPNTLEEALGLKV